ncbi:MULTISPECIES: DsbE family thiol:disulfide interchange protein [unclassified Brevundimonas]|uniref:DsbE family thiol:disulfide interchange protein n=1 Tax=unclassified Brevundimonas TaxID=2622653 RepID=UPI0025BB7046|nr:MULTISPECIES: DsbE family thiol:disulfide interchange protein [unclassified Brevundimonas]
MSRWMALLPIVALVLLGGFLAFQMNRMADSGQGAEYRPAALVGKPLPETVLPMLEGAVASEKMLDPKTAAVGKPVVVNVFASWCAPCRLEHPQLMALKAKGVKIIGIAYKDDPARTRAFLDELGDPFDVVLVDREGRAGLDLGISGVPETFVVDAYGVIRHKASGPVISEQDGQDILAAYSSL